MANLIQIKRSLTSASPGSLANGELAYTANGDVLFIGSNGSVVAIAGKRTPGTLSANQALVANATGYLDYVKTANAWITTLNANGSIGTAGQVLVSNGSTIYWGTGTTGSNTQVQFNDSGVANASAGFTFDKSANNLFVANTITTTTVVANNIGGSALNLNSNVTFNANLTTAGALTTLGGTNTYITSNTVISGTNTVVNSNSLFTANVTVSGALTTLAGTNTYITSNSTISGTNLTVNANSTLNGTTTVVTSNTVVNGTTSIINSNLTVNSTSMTINSNTNFAGRISSNFAPTVNNSYDIGSTTYYWRNGYFGTSVNIGNSTISDSNGTLVTNNFTVNNFTVNAIIGTTTNITSNVNITGGHIYANNSQLSVQSANVSGSLYIGNDLYVGGNVISQNVSTLNVADAFIYLAGNNVTSDVIDTGWISHYNNGANVHAGIFRHAATDQFYIFHNWPYEPYYATTIDIANTAFQLSTLNAYIIAAGLVSNATNVAITANSSLAVNITANNITLSSPLAGTSGGTGLNTYTNQDILVANATNGFSKLSLGTNGYLLQSNGSALVYGSIDGGTF